MRQNPSVHHIMLNFFTVLAPSVLFSIKPLEFGA